MSFASQAREEIAQRSLQLQKDCCVRAAAYGIACFAKYFDARGLVLQTEQELTARVAEIHPVPTCRNADGPYHEGQYVLTVDGFLTTPNVTVSQATVLDTGFAWSDHNPVKMTFMLS